MLVDELGARLRERLVLEHERCLIDAAHVRHVDAHLARVHVLQVEPERRRLVLLFLFRIVTELPRQHDHIAAAAAAAVVVVVVV